MPRSVDGIYDITGWILSLSIGWMRLESLIGAPWWHSLWRAGLRGGGQKWSEQYEHGP